MKKMDCYVGVVGSSIRLGVVLLCHNLWYVAATKDDSGVETTRHDDKETKTKNGCACATIQERGCGLAPTQVLARKTCGSKIDAASSDKDVTKSYTLLPLKARNEW